MSRYNTDKLTVKYQVFGGHDINMFIDKKIEKVTNACGLSFVGSGYDFGTKTRDLKFESPLIDLSPESLDKPAKEE